MIKEAILNSEKEKVREFLLKFDLNYENSVDLTLYIEENDEIIGTVSKENYIIPPQTKGKKNELRNLQKRI